MPRISSYPVVLNSNSYAIVQIGSANYKVELSDLLGSAIASPVSTGAYVDDCLHDFTGMISSGFHIYPWMASNIGVGQITSIQSIENHPGIARITQNGSNTGASIWLGNNSNILLAGEEEAEFIIKILTPISAIVSYMGFADNMAVTGNPTDAAIVHIDTSLGFQGRCFNAGVNTNTATTYIPSLNTWYRVKIVVNSNASRVDFYIYDESGNLLWTDNVQSNIPTAAGRELSHGIKMYKTSAGIVDLLDIDYISFFCPRVLTR